MGTNLRNKKIQLKRDDLVYPELSYEIIGAAFNVYDELGHGFKEQIYQRALAVALDEAGIDYEEQLYSPIIFKSRNVGKNYFDFLVEDKIVIELKKGDRFVKAHIEQLYQYLKSKDLRLGILIYFGPNKLHFKRVVNIKNNSS